MLNYTSVLKDFALDNKGLCLVHSHDADTPFGKDCVSHLVKPAVSSYRKVRTLQESCDYHRFMDCHSSDFHEYWALDSVMVPKFLDFRGLD
jgi:hypothetical protein